MKITSFKNEPISEFRFLNAGKGPGDFYVDRLPIHIGCLSGLPDDLDAIIATADLQGREQFCDANGGPPRLLGEVLPEKLIRSVLPEIDLNPKRIGIILAGDFYTVPNLEKRGGSGDVTHVWKAFAREFKWVVGVAGNHDMFGDTVAPISRLPINAHYLDGDIAELDEITIGGIGGIVGNPRKPHRKTDDEFISHLDLLRSLSPHILVMHDGPNDPVGNQRGSSILRETVELLNTTLLIRGHAHWSHPLIELSNKTQVLNVDSRVAILTR